jgi:hypothetical protein
MSAPVRPRDLKLDPDRIDPVAVFKARAEARALLFAAGELDLLDAVDALQADAVANGLVRQFGQDAVQVIMATAFAAVRDAQPETFDAWNAPCWSTAAASSTLQAAEFLMREHDPARLRTWLDRHSPAERKAILAHLQQRRGARRP